MSIYKTKKIILFLLFFYCVFNVKAQYSDNSSTKRNFNKYDYILIEYSPSNSLDIYSIKVSKSLIEIDIIVIDIIENVDKKKNIINYKKKKNIIIYKKIENIDSILWIQQIISNLFIEKTEKIILKQEELLFDESENLAVFKLLGVKKKKYILIEMIVIYPEYVYNKYFIELLNILIDGSVPHGTSLKYNK